MNKIYTYLFLPITFIILLEPSYARNDYTPFSYQLGELSCSRSQYPKRIKDFQENRSKRILKDIKSGNLLKEIFPDSELVSRENQRTTEFLSHTGSFEQTVRDRYNKLSVSSQPIKRTFNKGALITIGGRMIWETNNGQQIDIISKDEIFPFRISNVVISPDGSKVAFQKIKNGREIGHWNIRNIATNSIDLLKENIISYYFDHVSWSKDSSGIYYAQWEPNRLSIQPKPTVVNVFQSLLGGEPKIIFDSGRPELYYITDLGSNELMAHRIQADGIGLEKKLAIFIGKKNDLGKYLWRSFSGNNKYVGTVIGQLNRRIFVRSNKPGDNYGLVEFSRNGVQKIVVKAKKDKVLDYAQLFGKNLILQYFDKRTFAVSVRILDARTMKKTDEFSIEEIRGTASGTLKPFIGREDSNIAYFQHHSHDRPPLTMSYDFNTKKIKKIGREPQTDFDFSKVDYKIMHVKSSDGALVPVQIYQRKDRDGPPRFVFNYFYGAIGIKYLPRWDRIRQIVLEMGGAFVQMSPRGGGIKGANWFLQGANDHFKVLEDIDAVGSYVQNFFKVGKEKMVASGRSWGGTHTLALMAHKPDNFSVYLPVVPVININRFFNIGMLGRFAHSDFGVSYNKCGEINPSKSWWDGITNFEPSSNLYKLSTNFHVLLSTSDGDMIVNTPEQAHPFVREIRQTYPNWQSFYYKENIGVGHGSRSYFADQLVFLAKIFNITRLNK